MKSSLLKIIFICILVPCSSFAQEAEENIGEQIFKKKCAGCHGKDGNVQAYGISRKLTEIPSAEMGDRLKLFQSDKNLQNSGGVSAVMGKQVSVLDKQEFGGVLLYIQQNFAADK
ncbi:MAG: c-type cytochrome [Campylobacteraceae bacterium]|jgi:mono/diheme cytochrome c family protein|nr:c-type cytochrome [Campylobacteraceae bacterium]